MRGRSANDENVLRIWNQPQRQVHRFRVAVYKDDPSRPCSCCEVRFAGICGSAEDDGCMRKEVFAVFEKEIQRRTCIRNDYIDGEVRILLSKIIVQEFRLTLARESGGFQEFRI